MTPQRIDILTAPIDMLTLEQAVSNIEGWIRTDARRYVCHVDARLVLAARDDPDVRQALAGAGISGPDGIPLVWIGRARGHAVGRIYGPDFMEAVFEATSAWKDRRCRHVLFGSTRQVAERLRERLIARHGDRSDIAVVAAPFGEESALESDEIYERINLLEPDIVWVGLGAPRQELWMARSRDRLAAPVLLGVGAAFDFLSGNKRQAPKWVRRSGLEWLFRLAMEPGRLWSRYSATVPRFAYLAILEQMKRRP